MSAEPRQSPAQLRASEALKLIRNVEPRCEHEADFVRQYLTAVESMPATILTNGLGQALAMLFAKGEDGQGLAFEHMQTCLLPLFKSADGAPATDVLQAIIGSDKSLYLHAHHEALAFLDWLKKFAVAILAPKVRKRDRGHAG